jgi:transcriptional regulator with XRE-family HTH domain
MLAGVSVDYVVRLEQGRGPHPSVQVLTALARALRLNDDERDEMFLLAGSTPPRPDEINLLVRPSVHRLIDRLSDLPVMVISAKGDILAWNALAAALVRDWSAVPVLERNIIWQRFLGDPDDREHGRVAMTAEESAETDAQSVATLRAAAARYPGDAGLTRLVSELRRRSPRFAELWREGWTVPWRSHAKTVDHPTIGLITLDCDSMHLPDGDQTVMVYSAEAGSAAAESLELLRVIGTQRMTPAR